MVAIRHGSVCITGNFRENNEDRCLVDNQNRFFLVCDGMGGQAAGEKASELATELVAEKLEKLLDFESTETEEIQAVVDQASTICQYGNYGARRSGTRLPQNGNDDCLSA